MDELVSEEVKDLANCCATSSQKFSTVSALQLTGMCYLKEEEEEEIKKKNLNRQCPTVEVYWYR